SRHGIGLRKIPPEFSSHWVYVLRQQTVTVSQSKRVDEHVSGFIGAPNLPQCIDQPKAANQKGRFGRAEIVGSDIPHNVVTAPKFMRDRVYRCRETRVFGGQQAEFAE